MWRAGCACIGTALVLAALAFTSWTLRLQLDQQNDRQYDPILKLLTVTFVGASIAAIILGFGFLLAFLAIWVHRYFHTVAISPGKWYATYWANDGPGEDIANVSGMQVTIRDWAGRVKLTCRASFGQQEVQWDEYRDRYSGFSELRQQKITATNQPEPGARVIIVLTVSPAWWRGRPCQRIQRAEALNFHDYRTKPSALSTAT
jgi:hypothetical protein